MVDSLFKKKATLLNGIRDLATQAESKSSPESDNVTVVALRWNESSVVTAPADLSMSLKERKHSQLEPPNEEIDVTRAIEDLKRIVDDLEME